MHPTLHLFGRDIPVYGMCIAIGIFVAWGAGSTLGKRARVGADMSTSLLLAALVGGALGARVLAIVTEWRYFADDLTRVFELGRGGVAYGGILGALGATLLFGRIKKYRLIDCLDAIAPLLCAGHVLGRLGCFFAGCCFGKPAAWGMAFPHDSMAFLTFRRTAMRDFPEPLIVGDHTVPLVPTQLLEASGLLCLAIFLFVLLWQRRPSGTVFFSYIGLYAALRFCVEFFRFDDVRGWIIPGALSMSQSIALFFFALAATGFFFRDRFALPVIDAGRGQERPPAP